MERGVYFDAWFPRQHCYHPSLPPRRLRMVDDLRDYRATALVWASLGGGSLSLPYLQQEAFGPVEPRSRFYGFVNDSEFIAECHKHGIKVFGVVFEAQGWEFPVELNDAEDTVLALNELRGVGRRGWLGLREFSGNRYPKLWPPVETYFPDGLVNSDGERVTDLIEECCSRDIDQTPCHAHWVECPDREHQCFYMDRNNPVWREYLKAVIRIQIDAGVDGVQLDEAELPLGAMQYGACFCKDCIKGFRAYLREQDPSVRAPELLGVDLETFHYRQWLLERGFDFKSNREETPLFGDYYAFQARSIKTYFGELADYIRAYGRERGRDVLVSGNFFNLDPHYLPLSEDVDVVITEMRNTTYRQPEWYRYVAGFGGDKDVIVVENPYGGVVPELVEGLKRGRGLDRFRASLYEAAAFGANMSVSYGAWMGSRIEDAFYAPHEIATEIQTFLSDNERLYSKQTHNAVAVVYSVESNRLLVSKQDASDNVLNLRDESVTVPYRTITAELAAAAVPFDVVIFPDAATATDRVGVHQLDRYRTVVLPHCTHLTQEQADGLRRYVDGGGTLVVLGELATNLGAEVAERLLEHQRVHRVPFFEGAVVDDLLPLGPQVAVRGATEVSANIARLPDGAAAVHLLNYLYDEGLDRTTVQTDVEVIVDVPVTDPVVTLFTGDGKVAELEVSERAGRYTVRLPDLGLYAVVLFEPRRAQEDAFSSRLRGDA